MTQTNTSNAYTVATMDSTEIYNYLKRLARKTSNDTFDCMAEAIISSYGDDCDISTREVKAICACGYMSTADYREMECYVTTSIRTVRLSEAHVD